MSLEQLKIPSTAKTLHNQDHNNYFLPLRLRKGRKASKEKRTGNHTREEWLPRSYGMSCEMSQMVFVLVHSSSSFIACIVEQLLVL